MKITATKNIVKKKFEFPLLMIRGEYKQAPEIEGEIYLIASETSCKNYTGTIIYSSNKNRIGKHNEWDGASLTIYNGKMTLEN